MEAILSFIGVVMLLLGADFLVRGASNLALRIGISELAVGLIIVGFGTSAPEFVVTAIAAHGGSPELALGNVIGSNMGNLLLILGICALILPITVTSSVSRIDGPFMTGSAIVVYFLAHDGILSRLDGLLLLLLLGLYVTFSLWRARATHPKLDELESSETPNAPRSIYRSIGEVMLGLAGLILGSKWVVAGAVAAAHYLGLSELLVGLTVVAIGTSLPEILTSVVGSMRGYRDLAIGNIVGSNIFNALGVLGLGCVVGDGISVPQSVLQFDLIALLAVSGLAIPIFASFGGVSRWEGFLLVVAYCLYILMAYLKTSGSAQFSETLHGFYLLLAVTAVLEIYSIVAASRSRATSG